MEVVDRGIERERDVPPQLCSKKSERKREHSGRWRTSKGERGGKGTERKEGRAPYIPLSPLAHPA